MIFITIYLAAILFVVLMALLSAWSDITSMKIENAYSILIAVAFIVAYGSMYFAGKHDIVFDDLWRHLVSFAIILVLTMLAYSLKMIGAGDSKMASACALWVVFPFGLISFIFSIALAGGILAIATIVIAKWKPMNMPTPESWIANAQKGEGSVPYGAAIAIGLIFALVKGGYFDLLKIGVIGS